MKIELCQLESACKSSGFERFEYFLTGGYYGISASSSSSATSFNAQSASSHDNCHAWGFDEDELTRMWNKLHGYNGMYYAINVIKDYDDEGHCYTWEFRQHLEEWIKKHSVFPVEHKVNCGSKCEDCGVITCTECKGNTHWYECKDEWVFFCKECYEKEEVKRKNDETNKRNRYPRETRCEFQS